MGMIAGSAALSGGGDVGRVNNRQVAQDYRALVGAYKKELPGLIDSFTENMPKFSAATLADMERLQPGISALLRKTDPGGSALTDKLTAEASQDLSYGAHLDPGLLRQAQQSVRSRGQGTWAGTGRAGDFQEALGISSFANNLRNQRRGFAADIANLNYNTRTVPQMNMMSGISGAGQGALMSPAQSAGLLQSAYQSGSQRQVASAQNYTSLMSAANSSFLGV